MSIVTRDVEVQLVQRFTGVQCDRCERFLSLASSTLPSTTPTPGLPQPSAEARAAAETAQLEAYAQQSGWTCTTAAAGRTDLCEVCSATAPLVQYVEEVREGRAPPPEGSPLQDARPREAPPMERG